MMTNDSPELRAALTAVETRIDSLSTIDRNAALELRAVWNTLIAKLDMGPAPLVRECPHCKHTVMQAATRCGYCWHSLEPVGAAATH